MLKYIEKSEYFSWVERFSKYRTEYSSATSSNLKDIQDHYMISLLDSMPAMKVLEIGGGDCRVLREFSSKHECWNAEPFEGVGLGPKHEIHIPGIRNARVSMGSFSPVLPEGYFDLVFSISVVEHVPTTELCHFFKDVSRVLSTSGLSAHAIDMYVFDPKDLDQSVATFGQERLAAYLAVPSFTGGSLQFVERPVAGPSPTFSCHYASNSDREMIAWNRYAPSLIKTRKIAQSVSLRAEWKKYSV